LTVFLVMLTKHWGTFHVLLHKNKILGIRGYLTPFLSVRTLEQIRTMFSSKKTPKYICELCTFDCMRKSEYNRHLLTAKHKNASNDLQKDLQETYLDLQNTYTSENTKKIKINYDISLCIF